MQIFHDKSTPPCEDLGRWGSDMSNKPAFHMRNLSPMPTVQYRLVVFAVIVGFLGLVPVVLLDTWMIGSVSMTLGQIDPTIGLDVQETLVAYKNRLLIAYVGSMAVIMATAVAGGLFLTQKMVGPVYKLIHFLNKISTGDDPGAFKLRDQDDFRDSLEPAVNSALEKIRSGHKI